MICKMVFTSKSYFHLMEAGTLEKGDGYDAFHSGYYRWHGALYRRKRGKVQQNVEHLLCVTEDEYTEFISISLQIRYLCTMCLK